MKAVRCDTNKDRKVEPSMFLGLMAFIIWRNSLGRKRAICLGYALDTLCLETSEEILTPPPDCCVCPGVGRFSSP